MLRMCGFRGVKGGEHMNLFTPKGFLQVGGVVLLVVGLAGYFIIGPTPQQSIFGEFWWFDNAENIAHTVLGIVGLAAAYTLSSSMQKNLVAVLGVVGVLVGLYNFMGTELLGANLESPADLVLHLVVGAWALYAAFGGAKATGASA